MTDTGPAHPGETRSSFKLVQESWCPGSFPAGTGTSPSGSGWKNGGWRGGRGGEPVLACVGPALPVFAPHGRIEACYEQQGTEIQPIPFGWRERGPVSGSFLPASPLASVSSSLGNKPSTFRSTHQLLSPPHTHNYPHHQQPLQEPITWGEGPGSSQALTASSQ